MKTKLTSILGLLLISTTLFAQKPSWTDYYKRQQKFPDTKYISGFVSGVLQKNQDVALMTSKYEQMSKARVVENIQLIIETNNQLNVSNINGKSTEEFKSNSLSLSKANISGLVTKSFYDRKNREIYAFSYIDKLKTIEYYKRLIFDSQLNIKQKLEEAKNNLKSDNKKEALKNYYQCYPFLNKIDESVLMLAALDEKAYTELKFNDITQIKQKINSGIDRVQNTENISSDEAAYFAAYGLFVQLDNPITDFRISEPEFRNFQLISDFSSKWKQAFEHSFVNISKASSNKNSTSTIVSNYDFNDNYLEVTIAFYRSDSLTSAARSVIPLKNLNKENIDYLPNEYRKFESLSSVEFELIASPKIIKNRLKSNSPIIVRVKKNGQLLNGFPIAVVDKIKWNAMASALSDNGESSIYLKNLDLPEGAYEFYIMPSLSEYLNLSKDHFFIKYASLNMPCKTLIITTKVENPAVYVKSSEVNHSRPLRIKVLEPELKNILLENYFNICESEKDSDFVLICDAKTTSDNNASGIYLTFLDVNISMIENSTKEEIISYNLNQIKGGGSDANRAGLSAFNKAAKQLENLNFNQ